MGNKINFFVEKYEYKSPGYKLSKRNKNYAFNEEDNRRQSRFTYNEDENAYRSNANDKEEISMLFAGDLLCQENIIERYKTGENEYDFTLCYEYIWPLLKSSDFSVGNLETPIADTAPYRGEIITHEGPFYCNAPISYLKALKYAGFDMLTTANNHAIDAGARGIYETITNVRKYDFIQTGTFVEKCDKYVIVDICGFKVGFTAFGTTYNSMDKNLLKTGRITLLNTYSENRATTLYEKMREAGAEYIIAFPHWGTEFSSEITEKQYKIANTLTELGYDCVLGSHAHIVQKFEYVNGKPVLFGLGNLMTHMNLSGKGIETQYPVICNLTLKRENDKIIDKIDFIPCRILKDMNKIPFTVIPCTKKNLENNDLGPLLSESIEHVKNMLEVSDSLLQLDYPVKFWGKNSVNGQRGLEERISALPKKVEKSTSVGSPKASNKKYLFRWPWEKKERLECSGEYVYKIQDKTAVLTRFLSNASVVRLEEEVAGLPVVAVHNMEKGNNTTRIIYFGKQTEIVGARSFVNFKELESVRFYKDVKIIEKQAFEGCTKMMGLNMPAALEIIEKKAFKNCRNLRTVKFGKNVTAIAKDAFEGCENLTIYCYEGSYPEKYAKERRFEICYIPEE